AKNNIGKDDTILQVIDAYLKPKCHSADSDFVLKTHSQYPFQRTKLHHICAVYFEWPSERTDVSCFQGLLFCPEAASLMLRNFCIYHIDAPGHELGADVISSDEPLLCVDDLADQVAEVLDFFGLREVMCMGVTAGAYILTLFAMKYKERVLGLILVSPICKGPSWTE
ncbi:hypothetical protein RYX36_002296, partial [Vicia faba]